jgi:hypothetical protein
MNGREQVDGVASLPKTFLAMTDATPNPSRATKCGEQRKPDRAPYWERTQCCNKHNVNNNNTS